MWFHYSYDMNLEYFADQNDFELCEDDLNNLFIYVGKGECSKNKLLLLVKDSGFDFDIEEHNDFYKVV